MADVTSVANAATRLYREKDEVSLEILIGLRATAIEQKPELAENVDFEPTYEAKTMGAIDDVKALGKRLVSRWNKELYGVVCGTTGDNKKDRQAVLNSLNLGEAAVIGAVAGALLSLGLAAALAAAIAPLIVKRFIWPAKDELCQAWSENLG